MGVLNSTTQGSYAKSVAITKSDTTVFDLTKALYITGTGNVVVVYQDGSEDTFTAVPANTILPLSVIKVKEATSATGIKALY
jgi:hypothetical protein